MKKSIKLICFLMSMLIVLSVFASCNNGNDSGAESTTPNTPPSASTPAATTPDASATPPNTPESSTKEDLISLLPEKMELGIDMSIFCGELYYDEWLDQDNGDIVGTEVFNRIPRTEENLGIELTVDRIVGDSPKREDVMNEVKKRQETTDPNLMAALCSTYSMFAGALTLEGRYQVINNSDNIDLENPWWPKDLMENSTIDDKVYFVSGDISPTLIYETYAIFYNRDLIDRYNIDDPISLVNSNEWTLDKVIEITSGIYEDIDTSVTGPNKGDFIAFNFNDAAHLKSFPFALGIRVLVPDEENGYIFDESYTSQKMEIIFDKMSSWIENNPGVNNGKKFNDYGSNFVNGNTIFNVGNFAYAAIHLSGSGVDYGVVPCPKYDSEQEDYFSYYGNPTSFWGIPSNADIDNSCALLEYLAADAYVYISPALFERALKFKYVTGEVDGLSKMFDIIREGLVFDASMFYYFSLSGTYGQFKELETPGASWLSKFNAFMTTKMKVATNNIVTKLRELEY